MTGDLGAQYLELRHIRPVSIEMPTNNFYYTFIKELPQDKVKCLEMLPRKARAAARKGIDSGLRAEVGVKFLKEFYDVYAVSVRNLGSPVFPLAFLKNIINEFRDSTAILVVRYKGKPVSSVFTFLYKNTIMPYYAGSLSKYFEYQPNNFMYLKLMEFGVEKGCRYFDFGRSKLDSGSYKFKEYQGFAPQPLYYQYYLNGRDSIPDTSSKNPRLSLAVSMWQKMPVWLTKIIGARVIRFTPP